MQLKKGILNPIAPFYPIVAVIAAFIVNGILLYAVIGIDPVTAYIWMFRGALGSVAGIGETAAKAAPLLLCGLGIALAARANLWNIGAEGQLLMGGLIAAVVGLGLRVVPSPILIPLILILSFAAGASWGIIPGILKAKFDVNEVITTLMMNYVALFIVDYLVLGPLRGPPEVVGYQPMTDFVPENARLPRLIPGTRFHFGFIIAILLVPLIYIILNRLAFGYRVRAVGGERRAAQYAGMNVPLTIILTMALAGGLAGLAGMGEVCGIQYAMRIDISPGYGYTAIIVAVLGKLKPTGVLLAAILFGALMVGAEAMKYLAGVPYTMVDMLQGLVLLFVLGWRTRD